MLTQEIRAQLSTRIQNTILNIEAQTNASLAAERERKERFAQAEVARNARNESERRLARKRYSRRIGNAASGVETLLAMTTIDNIYLLAKNGGDNFLPPEAPKGGFIYYLAQDDLETVAVILYPGEVLVIYNGAPGSEEGTHVFHHPDTRNQIREKLKKFETLGSVDPMRVLLDLAENKNITQTLSEIAFGVLEDACNEKKVRTYFDVATALYERKFF